MHYDGLHNNKLQDRQEGRLIDIYVKNLFSIRAGNNILFLDMAITRKYAQERRRIMSKKIFRNLAGQLD
jgi:hypothetical protein